MELDPKTSDILVEMIRTKNGPKGRCVATFDVQPSPSSIERVNTARSDDTESRSESTKDSTFGSAILLEGEQPRHNVDNKSQVAGLLALVANVMLEKARELSGQQAFELWRFTELINTGASLESLPRATLQLAMDFNRFPLARQALEHKALAYESATKGVSP